MAYDYYVFERYDLVELARDVSEVLTDVPPERIVSISHSSATDSEGVRYSAFIVLERSD